MGRNSAPTTGPYLPWDVGFADAGTDREGNELRVPKWEENEADTPDCRLGAWEMMERGSRSYGSAVRRLVGCVSLPPASSLGRNEKGRTIVYLRTLVSMGRKK